MEKYWNNDILNRKIENIYTEFKTNFKRVIHSYCNTEDFKISQDYPNRFQFSSFQIEFFLKDKYLEPSVKIEFPSVNIYNDELYFFDNSTHRNSSQKLFSSLLSKDFAYKKFRTELSEIFNIFYEQYNSLISDNFAEIRNNYFKDIGRKLQSSELKMFEKPAVLLRCEVSTNTRNYGYKAGEGRNYVHSHYVKYTDVNNYSDANVKAYLEEINLSNPKDNDTEYYEINPNDFSHTLQQNYFDLDLSKKINWYIKLNLENNNQFDFKSINHTPIVRKHNDNFAIFECLIIIYVITKFELSSILIFLTENEKRENQSYRNQILLSQYFLNKKHSYFKFLSEYNSFRDKIIPELRKKNFKGDKFDRICSAFEIIGGSKSDLLKLKYFYVNYRMTNEDINYDNLFFIIKEYFKE